MPSLNFTHRLVRIALSGQKDKSGESMYSHAVRVHGNLVNPTPAEEHAALLHDIVEDTDCTFYDLSMFGYSNEVVGMVRLLTHDKAELTYRQYLQKIMASGSLGAVRIKLADNKDNSDPRRHVKLDPEDSAFLLKRYAMARTILQP